jgi:hypothetical protein
MRGNAAGRAGSAVPCVKGSLLRWWRDGIIPLLPVHVSSTSAVVSTSPPALELRWPAADDRRPCGGRRMLGDNRAGEPYQDSITRRFVFCSPSVFATSREPQAPASAVK